MNEPLPGDPGSDVFKRWKHDLRNAVNSASLALHVADRMIESGNIEGATAHLRRAREACDLMANLLHTPDSSSPAD